MSDLPLDKENQRRNVPRTPGLPSSKKVVPVHGRSTPVASMSSTPSTTTANDAAHFAAMRSPPGSSKVLRKRWEMQFEKEQAELRQQQQPRLMEKGAVRLAAQSPVPMSPMTMLTSSMDDVVMRNSSNNNSSTSPIPDADLHDAEGDEVNTTCDSDQSLGFLVEPVSARKDCTNPVAMTLLHSDDGMEDVTFLLQHDCTTSTTITPSKGSSTRRQSPLTCSARVPVQNVIARPVAARPTFQREPQKQQFYRHDHHYQYQQQQHHQQQYYYHQQQEQQQQQYYHHQQQQQQQRPYSHITHQF
jgi:hypothetical protein